jgi:hypothetical protein
MVKLMDWEDLLVIHWMSMKEMKLKMKMIVVVVVVVELMAQAIFHLDKNQIKDWIIIIVSRDMLTYMVN